MFFIFEIQIPHEGNPATLVNSREDKNHALSVYHGILQYAAISNLAIHTAIVTTDEGECIARESFYHDKIEE